MGLSGGGGFPTNRVYAPRISETATYTHSLNDSYTLYRTLTIGGTFTGKRIISIYWEQTDADSSGGFVQIKNGSVECNLYKKVGTNAAFCYPYAEINRNSMNIIDVSVESGNILTILGRASDGGTTSLSISKINVFCQDDNVSIVAS